MDVDNDNIHIQQPNLLNKKPKKAKQNKNIKLQTAKPQKVKGVLRNKDDDIKNIRLNFIAFEDIVEGQLHDPICYIIREYIQSNFTNDEVLKDLPDIFLRHVKKNRNFRVKKGVVYFYDKEINKERIYCPAEFRFALIQYVHEQYHHIRYEKMRQLMIRKYFWPSMLSDINTILGVCEICNQNQKDKHSIRTPLETFPANHIFQVLHIDLVGPFKKSKNGYKYAITMCDRLSRYLQIVPLKNMKALTCAKAIVNRWVTNFGVPQQIISDQGTQFEGKIFDHFTDLLGTHKSRTTAYRPLSNGRLERMHREVKKHLRVLAATHNLNFSYSKKGKTVDNWDEYLDIIKFKLNATPSRITGCAPIELILGYIPTMPEDSDWTYQPKGKPIRNKGFREYVQWLNNIKKIVLENARIDQAKYDHARKKKYDKHVTAVPQYKIGDLVRFYIFDANKLSPQWSEKHRIIDFYDKYIVRIQDTKTNKYKTVNIDHIKLATHTHLPQLETTIVSKPDITTVVNTKQLNKQAKELVRRNLPKKLIKIKPSKINKRKFIDVHSGQSNPLHLPNLHSIGDKRKNVFNNTPNKRRKRKNINKK